MNSEEPIYHLLKPKEFRVWCLPSRAPGTKMNVTNLVSKANCANCLSILRRSQGKKQFRVRWTNRHNPLPRTPELEE